MCQNSLPFRIVASASDTHYRRLLYNYRAVCDITRRRFQHISHQHDIDEPCPNPLISVLCTKKRTSLHSRGSVAMVTYTSQRPGTSPILGLVDSIGVQLTGNIITYPHQSAFRNTTDACTATRLPKTLNPNEKCTNPPRLID